MKDSTSEKYANKGETNATYKVMNKQMHSVRVVVLIIPRGVVAHVLFSLFRANCIAKFLGVALNTSQWITKQNSRKCSLLLWFLRMQLFANEELEYGKVDKFYSQILLKQNQERERERERENVFHEKAKRSFPSVAFSFFPEIRPNTSSIETAQSRRELNNKS